MTPESGQPGPSPPSHRARLPGAILALFGAAIGLEAHDVQRLLHDRPGGPESPCPSWQRSCAWAWEHGPRCDPPLTPARGFALGKWDPDSAAAATAFVAYAYTLPVLGFFF